MKWCGVIGFGEQIETSPGVWTEKIVERRYYGDLTKDTRSLQSQDNVNDNINILNKISVVADPYANENMYSIRYANIKGIKWKVSNIEVSYPRLLLTLGGLYNG